MVEIWKGAFKLSDVLSYGFSGGDGIYVDWGCIAGVVI